MENKVTIRLKFGDESDFEIDFNELKKELASFAEIDTVNLSDDRLTCKGEGLFIGISDALISVDCPMVETKDIPDVLAIQLFDKILVNINVEKEKNILLDGFAGVIQTEPDAGKGKLLNVFLSDRVKEKLKGMADRADHLHIAFGIEDESGRQTRNLIFIQMKGNLATSLTTLLEIELEHDNKKREKYSQIIFDLIQNSLKDISEYHSVLGVSP